MTKEDYYYYAHIEPYIDDSLKLFVEKIRKDGTFKRENSPEPWSKIIQQLIRVLRYIVYEVFGANAESIDFFKFGLNLSYKSIEDLICLVENILVNKFEKSPPFTIFRFINILFFLNSKVSIDYIPLAENVIVENNEKLGLKKYHRTVNDLVMGTKVKVEVINRYHKLNRTNGKKYDSLETDIGNETENDADNETNDETVDEIQPDGDDRISNVEDLKFSKNDVKAVKYLKSLINVISVESSIDDVDNELLKYGSKNITINKNSTIITNAHNSSNKDNNNNNDVGDDDTVSDSSVNSIKMVKIPWYDPNMLSQGLDNDIQ